MLQPSYHPQPNRTANRDCYLMTSLILRIMLVLTCLLPLALPAAVVEASETTPDLFEIPSGPGQVCIKYVTGYSSLIDWRNGPAEMPQSRLISYADVKYSHTVHSCAGSPSFPGSLPGGKFFLLLGGLIAQAAIVDIKRIEDRCPYMLTYYWLTSPAYDGTCTKDTSPTNTATPDTGKPECNDQVL